MAPLLFKIVTYGEEKAAINFEQMGLRAFNARPAFERIYLRMLDIEQEIFEREGNRGQAPWEILTLTWLSEKVEQGLDPRILHATGRLRRSMTTFRSPDQYTRIERSKIVFASKRAYAITHQKGWPSSGIPQRRFVHFTKIDQREFAIEILNHIRGRRVGRGVRR